MATEDEQIMLLARQMVFGCCDSTTLQKLLMLKAFDLMSIFVEMESQEKVNENVRVIHGGQGPCFSFYGAKEQGSRSND